MPHTIEVDDDVWQALAARAEPLVDTPNSVLRRVLLGAVPSDAVGPSPGARPSRGRNRRGDLLPETEYFVPILRALEERQGRAPTREVLDAVGDQLRDRLTP